MSEVGKMNEAILNQLKKESHRRVEIEAFKSAANCTVRACITTGLLSRADMILALKEIIMDLASEGPSYEEMRAYEDEIQKALGLPKVVKHAKD